MHFYKEKFSAGFEWDSSGGLRIKKWNVQKIKSRWLTFSKSFSSYALAHSYLIKP